MKPNPGLAPSALLALLITAHSSLLGSCANPPRGSAPHQVRPSETASPHSAEAPRPLLGQQVDGRLEASEHHLYTLDLGPSELIQLTVEQRGVDVAVSLLDPQGQVMLRVDSPNGKSGPEKLLALTEHGGTYQLDIRAFPKQPGGDYLAHLDQRRAATDDDRQRAAAMRNFAAAEELRRQRSYDAALERYREAFAIWERLGDLGWQGEVASRISLVASARGALSEAIEAYQDAADLFARAGELGQQSAALHLVGIAHARLGDAEKATHAYQKALELRRRTGSRRDVAATLNALGVTYRARGDMQLALETYEMALEIWSETGVPGDRAVTLVNQSIVYRQLGQERLARDRLEAAVDLYERLEAPRKLAGALDQLGSVYQTLGDHEKAMEAYRRALDLQRSVGDRQGEAVTLSYLGILQKQNGAFDEALDAYSQALTIFSQAGQRLDEARLLNNLASLHNARGQPEAALAVVEQALALARQVKEPEIEARSHEVAARAERALGRLDEARLSLERNLEILESVRARTGSLGLRATFHATAQERHDDYIDLLVALHEERPGEGYAELALAASERARARSLLEGLSEGRGNPREEADRRLLVQTRTLENELAALSAEKRRHLAGQGAGETLREIERRIREQVAALRQARARRRATTSREGEPSGPRPLSVEQIQRQVLEPGTLLLEYRLAAERSFLWVAAPESIRLFELPPRAQLEPLARDAAQLLARGSRREAQGATRRRLCELSRALLAPAAELLGDARLVVVADGALQYLPFAALPDPRVEDCASAPPLLLAHEVLGLPSASALAALRAGNRREASAEGRVAVIADPVFEASDPRVLGPRPRAEDGDERRRSRSTASGSFARLPSSRLEAEAIATLVPKERQLLALGFDASKEAALDSALHGYDIVHFATHGVLDTEHPELSGIVLSQVDERGTPQDGFLFAHELGGLNLSAELVVLSACRTALGAEIRGEGLVGLTQGIFSAGAERVIVSLWQVNDQLTAELMSRFYRHLLSEGQRPAAALRQAQLSLWREPATREPFWWAAFVLQGEWR